jgi:branched-chain amino acid transport system substrate-binding protein
MWHSKLSRRRFLALSGIALGSQLLGEGQGRAPLDRVMRIGLVLPAETGLSVTGGFPEGRIGEIAMLGAVLAEEEISAAAQLNETHYQVLIASAPNQEAAERLASVEEIGAIVGGIGIGQADALSRAAESSKIPFFNIGTSSDLLRGKACNRYTFHVEASDAMYMDALLDWFSRSGFRRCLFVQADSSEHEAHYQRARHTFENKIDESEVDRVLVSATQPVFLEVLEEVRAADIDIVVLLLDAASQLVFLGQYSDMGLEAPVTSFPSAATQTRDFYAALQRTAPEAGSGYRVALWEPTLSAHGAEELNERFLGRWGMPMDSPAWAAYQAIKMLYEATSSTGTFEAPQIIDYLEGSHTSFDVHKGAGTSFRPWDHQLRQPLYLVKINREAERPWNLATVVDKLPTQDIADLNPFKRLDRLGVLRDESNCRFSTSP